MTVYWHDGGKKPKSPPDVDLNTWGGLGMLFIGEKGQILSNYGRHLLLPKKQFADYPRPKPSIPGSIGHHREWVVGAKTGKPTPCNFDYAGKMTENILAGIVSCRVKRKLEWDTKALKATNCPAADRFIRKTYRKGWKLIG